MTTFKQVVKTATIVAMATTLAIGGNVSAPAQGEAYAGFASVEQAQAKIPVKVKVIGVSSPCGGKLVVKVKKVELAKNYKYQVATDKKFKKGVRTGRSKARTFTFRGLKRGARYYVRARAYDGKTYGKWSAVKKVKIKINTKKRAKLFSEIVPTLSVKSTEPGQVTATCGKVKGAYQYLFETSTTGKFSGRFPRVSSKPKINLCLQEGKTYWIRAYASKKSSAKTKYSKRMSVKVMVDPYVIAKADCEAYAKAHPQYLGKLSSAGMTKTVKSHLTGYSYSFRVLNEGDLYTDSTLLIYIKTDNPSPNRFTLVTDGMKTGAIHGSWSDIKYADNASYIQNGYTARKVEDGYLLETQFAKIGVKSIVLKEYRPDATTLEYGYNEPIYSGISLSLDISKDSAAERKAWSRWLAKKYAPDATTAYDKLRGIFGNINELFYYSYSGYDVNGEYHKGGAQAHSLWPAQCYMYSPWMRDANGEYRSLEKTGAARCNDLSTYAYAIARDLGVPESDLEYCYEGVAHVYLAVHFGEKTLYCNRVQTAYYNHEFDLRTFETGRLL